MKILNACAWLVILWAFVVAVIKSNRLNHLRERETWARRVL